ncbi:hypothetical protein MNBD_GAMMA06-599 [hydrothermal vent metagenome]|uniref:Uncharacterized protein n=1 Tax=hydrothermal vent metagenome TaxID=652676 RepID=A0A3B0WZU6_9ZZZZ
MNKLEQVAHKLIGDYPFLRIPLVALYQRACSVLPSKNFEVVDLEFCRPGFFFGFHDKCPWSYDGSKLLAHRYDVNKSVNQVEDESIDVGYFENDEFKFIGSTNAWNWQQGSSIQWVGKANKIIYNNLEQNKPVAKIVDLDTDEKESLPCHVMAVSNNGRYAVSCSFARLGKSMSGYGYKDQLSTNENDLLPDNEGLTIIDLESKAEKQILFLKDVIDSYPDVAMDGAYHLFSHCLFSPDDSRIVFFHRYLRKNGSLETRMFSCDMDGKNIWHFAGGKFSHIAWYGNSTVLAYSKPAGHEIGFYFLEEDTGRITAIVNESLTSDGHPQISSDGENVLIDTYPNRSRIQRLMLYNIEGNRCEPLVKYKIPFRYRLERRCDFHPRWNRDNTKICFDSAHKNVRALCVMSKPEFTS